MKKDSDSTEADFLQDVAKRRSLEYKLGHWPSRILGRKLDAPAPIPGAFRELKNRRNSLMHFASSHDTISFVDPSSSQHVVVQGLADTTAFDTLTPADAEHALNVAEDMLCEVFRLRGITETCLPEMLHAWTGKVPQRAGSKTQPAELAVSMTFGDVRRIPSA